MFPLYHVHSVFDKLHNLLQKAFRSETAPTQQTLMGICSTILVLNSCPSIRRMFKQYLAETIEKNITSVYYTLNKAKLATEEWGRFLLYLALTSTEEDLLATYPVIIITDDTIVQKFGMHFDDVGSLFNHTAKKEPKYVNGHCFVTVQVLIPRKSQNGDVRYFATPISHSVWIPKKHDSEEEQSQEKSNSKLEMAFERINKIIQQIQKLTPKAKIQVLCDSWYAKSPMTGLIENENVGMIVNVRHDTCLHELPQSYKGKGRPATRGAKINVSEIPLSSVPDTNYSIAHFTAIARVFSYKRVRVFITSCNRPGKKESRRVYICTDPTALDSISRLSLGGDGDKFIAFNSTFLPLALYWLRWKIETTYYEQKKFWGMTEYMLRSREGIDHIINLQLFMYSLMGLLPYIDPVFEELSELSMQERRFVLGKILLQERLLDTLLQTARETQSAEKSKIIEKFLCERKDELKIGA